MDHFNWHGEDYLGSAIIVANFTVQGEEYKVTFDENGGDTEASPKEITETYANKYSLPTQNPTKTGYTFSGWFTSPDGGEEITTSTDFEKTEPQTLSAHWTANEYTINADANTGEFPESSTTELTYTYDGTPINTGDYTEPTKTGYKFQGWYIKPDDTGAEVESIDKDNLTDVGCNIANPNMHGTVYAHWTANTYTIKFDFNKPSGASGSISGSTADKSMTYDTSDNLTANGYSLTGWTFNGWNSESDGTGTDYEDQQSVNNLSPTQGATVTLYAKWTANTYEIQFIQNKPENASNDVEGEMDKLEMTYDIEDNLTENAYTLKGWSFENWNLKADGTGEQYSDKSAVENLTDVQGGVVILYAQWCANEYSVTLEYDGGVGKVKEINAIYDKPMPALSSDELPTKDGYKFLGYFGNAPENNSKSDSVALNLGATVQYYNADGTSARNWDKDEESSVLVAHWEKTPEPVNLDKPEQNGSAITSTSDSISEFMLIGFAVLALAACYGIWRYSK